MTTTNSSKEESNQMKVFDTSFWFSIFIFCLLICIICFFPYWFTAPSSTERLNFIKTGPIGDTIGGIMGPFIAIAAAILTFIAFWVQFKANKQQTLQFEKQANDVKLERFENKYYELLRIQRENLNEIEIKEYVKNGDYIRSRKSFISMFYELRFCYAMTKKFIETYNHQELGFQVDDEATILDIAYHIFFMGIGENSDKLVIISLSGKCKQKFILDLITYLDRNVKTEYINNPKKTFDIRLNDNPNPLLYSSKYLPLGGHISRLGHYFRHLYQTVKFIARQDQKTINEDQKCDYVKTLRAQLSDYEQLMLYFNVISSLGKAWTDEKENFIKRFRMIKNMPLPLAEFAVIPRDRFSIEIEYWKKKGKSFFEWDERS